MYQPWWTLGRLKPVHEVSTVNSISIGKRTINLFLNLIGHISDVCCAMCSKLDFSRKRLINYDPSKDTRLWHKKKPICVTNFNMFSSDVPLQLSVQDKTKYPLRWIDSSSFARPRSLKTYAWWFPGEIWRCALTAFVSNNPQTNFQRTGWIWVTESKLSNVKCD
jgi:hypothetical protein